MSEPSQIGALIDLIVAKSPPDAPVERSKAIGAFLLNALIFGFAAYFGSVLAGKLHDWITTPSIDDA